jgi:hypothetical protein
MPRSAFQAIDHDDCLKAIREKKAAVIRIACRKLADLVAAIEDENQSNKNEDAG